MLRDEDDGRVRGPYDWEVEQRIEAAEWDGKDGGWIGILFLIVYGGIGATIGKVAGAGAGDLAVWVCLWPIRVVWIAILAVAGAL